MSSAKEVKVSLVVPIYNNIEITEAFLTSLFKGADENLPFEVICIDDGSEQDVSKALSCFPVTVLTNEKNRGYVHTTNKGIRHAVEQHDADYIVLMNNDLIMRGAWLSRLLAHTALYDITGFGGRDLLRGRKHMPTYYVEFSCAVIKRAVFDEIGDLDAQLASGYYTDDDFCLRALLAGYKVGLIKDLKPASVLHLPGQTFGSKKYDIIRATQPMFESKWRDQLGNPTVSTYFKKYCFKYEDLSFLRKLLIKLEPWLISILSARQMKKLQADS